MFASYHFKYFVIVILSFVLLAVTNLWGNYLKKYVAFVPLPTDGKWNNFWGDTLKPLRKRRNEPI